MAIDLRNYEPALKAGSDISTTGAITGGSLTSTAGISGTAITGTSVSVTAGAVVLNATAVPASAGAVAAGAPVTLFSAGPSLYVTSDVPSFSAVKGSLCINTAGSSTSTRLYVNNGTTNWVAMTSAS